MHTCAHHVIRTYVISIKVKQRRAIDGRGSDALTKRYKYVEGFEISLVVYVKRDNDEIGIRVFKQGKEEGRISGC